MDQVVLSIVAICAGLAAGSIVFQSFIVAPSVFGSLDATAARDFLRTLFPRFFRLNLVIACLACLALLASGLRNGWSTLETWGTAATAFMAIAMFASNAVVPTINAARDRGPSGETTFNRLHRLTVLLTVIVLLLAIGLLVAIASTGSR
ncbi:MAG: DUF4149 domain-containing protein [Pseudomonadota bacterium]